MDPLSIVLSLLLSHALPAPAPAGEPNRKPPMAAEAPAPLVRPLWPSLQ